MEINFDAVEKDVKGRLIHNECSKEYSAGAMDALSIVKLHGYERPTGHWCKTGQSFVNPSKFRNYCCSNCLYELDEHIRTEPNFCQNCGADMRGERK
jgi:hypothetical protein